MEASERFHKMLAKFKKTSKDKNREAEKCHSKSENKKKKSENAKQRKIMLSKKNNSR